MLDLLERGHVLDYIEQHSRNDATKGSRGGSSRVMGVVTWTSLFRSIVGYISKETEAIQKLEEKGSASSVIAQSNRVTKKKVNLLLGVKSALYLEVCVLLQDVAEILKAYIRACNKSESLCCHGHS